MTLTADSLSFGYPGHRVGTNVSIAIYPGEVLCLLGPNGCGKTTLFKTLLGLLAPLGGSIKLGDDDLTSLRRPEIARRIAYVPQATGIPFPYTVLDFVLMGRTSHLGLFAAPRQLDRDAAMNALAELGVDGLASREITTLSGGQRQLVSIARAIAQASPLIVMDEPTASLDFGNQVVVLSEVRERARAGHGIVLSTHDPDHAFAVADRVALMCEGTIRVVGTPAETLTPEALENVYGVRVTIEQLRDGRLVSAPLYHRRKS